MGNQTFLNGRTVCKYGNQIFLNGRTFCEYGKSNILK
jgi:hypothetical protein